ncbi:S41 family peptidase [Iodobacter sp. CM08]|uniref:S41 family peptidase n=1 Tax=Iodobacter sp. CM08 TaxID=3085902 RepID=UPI00298157DD|nr:S41 family peptidase [Iodobacter sp. CM08]MDW5416160.1 S41 family peptidase [Iodobacter sp. CM08]
MKLIKVATIALAMMSAFAHAEFRNDFLSNIRSEIKFEELSRNDKQVLAEQAQLLLRDLYVNRYAKDLYYGNNPDWNKGHVNPADAVQQVINNLDKLSTAQLHTKLSQIFLNQRDLHLNYNFPLPHAAFLSFLPINFARTTQGAEQNEVRIDRVYPRYFDALLSSIRKPEVGDQVLEYGGLPIKQAVNKVVISGAGANLYGGFSRAIQKMTLVSQSSNVPPENDRVLIKLRSAKTGEIYSIDLPWLVQYDDAALQPKATTTAAAKALKDQAFSQSVEKYQEQYNQFVSRNTAADDTQGFIKYPTSEPTITWSIVPKGDKQLGYINISSFVPQNPDQAVEIIAGLLRNQLAKTDALVVDVRSNGGGYISYADKLPQLFKPGKATTSSARLLNTKLNNQFLNQDDFRQYWPEWVKLINDAAKTKNTYSKTGVFTSPAEANALGQAYYKPVGVLANARSYSATDLFTCQMQDNGAATIYGEDPATGAGGANVLEHGFFAELGPNWFKPLPGGVSMRVSWRQSVRGGYNPNTIIEDYGCQADVNVPRVLSDLSNGDQTQFDKIAADLLAKPVSKSSFQFLSPVADVITVKDAAGTLDIQVAETEHVKVYVDDQLFETKTVYAYGTPQTVRLSLPKKTAGQSYVISIAGVDAGQAVLWNTKRVVKVLAQ